MFTWQHVGLCTNTDQLNAVVSVHNEAASGNKAWYISSACASFTLNRYHMCSNYWDNYIYSCNGAD